MHASGAADACPGRGVSWAVACASAAGRFSGSVGGSPAECRSCSVQVGARYGTMGNRLFATIIQVAQN